MRAALTLLLSTGCLEAPTIAIHDGGVDQNAALSAACNAHPAPPLESVGERAPCPRVNPGEIAWRSRAPMPTSRQEIGVAVVRGVIYAIGGAMGNAADEVEAYDPARDAWFERAPLPRRLRRVSAAAIGDTIYVAGGAADDAPFSNPHVYAYDTRADCWGVVTEVPGPAGDVPLGLGAPFVAMAAMDGKLYVSSTRSEYADTPDRYQVYDVASDAWTVIEPFPDGGDRFAMVVHDGMVWLGARGVGSFTPELGRWRAQARRDGVTGFGLVSAGGALYALGGRTEPAYAVVGDAHRLDERAGRWEPVTPMVSARALVATAEVDGRIYAIGGTRSGWLATEPTDHMEEGCLP